MAMVKCEFCGFDQDTDKSVICDNCGMRIVRSRADMGGNPKKEKPQDLEPTRCPNCGIQSKKNICDSCGALIRRA